MQRIEFNPKVGDFYSYHIMDKVEVLNTIGESKIDHSSITESDILFEVKNKSISDFTFDVSINEYKIKNDTSVMSRIL